MSAGVASFKQAMRGVAVTLQSAATTGNGIAVAVPKNLVYHRINVKGNGTIGAGAIQVESADNPGYTGTWNPIGSPISVVSSAEIEVVFTGSYAASRARISTTVTTTSVTVTYTAD